MHPHADGAGLRQAVVHMGHCGACDTGGDVRPVHAVAGVSQDLTWVKWRAQGGADRQTIVVAGDEVARAHPCVLADGGDVDRGGWNDHVNAVSVIARDGACVACSVGGHHARCNRLITIGQQIRNCHVDGELALLVHRSREILTVDDQRYHVAICEISTHRTHDRQGAHARFGDIDDVILSDSDEHDARFTSRRVEWVLWIDHGQRPCGVNGDQLAVQGAGVARSVLHPHADIAGLRQAVVHMGHCGACGTGGDVRPVHAVAGVSQDLTWGK